ncbi:MAG: hypothetical protein HY553_06250 [Elusimicrobia bacterium]|nr:hypothetical protein [Elusimicrobiota bacterium]
MSAAGEPPFGPVLAEAARRPEGVRVEYALSTGGVPPTVVRFSVEPTGSAVYERIHSFPPPAARERREGRVPRELVAALLAAFDGVEIEKLRPPVVDSFNQWFSITAGGRSRAFSIVDLRMPVPDPANPASPGRVHPAYARVSAAVDAILKALGAGTR